MVEAQVSTETFSKDVNDLLAQCLDQIQPVLMSPSYGIGVRAALPVQILVNDQTYLLEIFSEYTFPKTPEDDDLGFDVDNAKRFDGVLFCKVDHLDVRDEDRSRYYGAIYTLDEFKKQFVDTSTLEIILDRKIEQLRELGVPKENFMLNLNAAWFGRDPGTNTIELKHDHWC